jgi:hypothetical protein
MYYMGICRSRMLNVNLITFVDSIITFSFILILSIAYFIRNIHIKITLKRRAHSIFNSAHCLSDKNLNSMQNLRSKFYQGKDIYKTE